MWVGIGCRRGGPLKVIVIEDDKTINKEICFYLEVRYPDAIIIPVGNGLKGIKNDREPNLPIKR